jgi:hypothetical protein
MTTAAELRQQARDFRARNPDPPRASPPQEQGRRLATFERSDDNAEIRLAWTDYQGSPYLSIRVWARGQDGRMWPQKGRGFSVRVRELPILADAVAEALTLADQHMANRPRAGGDPAARGPAPTPRAQFDEFGGPP